MQRPDISAMLDYFAHEVNQPSYVVIPGTRRKLKMREIHPGTMKWLTRIWQERELATASVNSGAEVLKDLAIEPYFAFKEAALMILNHDIRIRLFYGLYWRYLAHRYDETQIVPIVEEGKKKLPLMAHYEIMVFSTDMRTDLMTMTKAEAERSLQELRSANAGK